MGDEGLVASWGEAWPGMTSSEVVAEGVSAAVFFFKSMSIWSCLAAIRTRDTLSFTKLAWMALMVASVVVVATPIASRKLIRTGICGENFVKGTWVAGPCGVECSVVISSLDPSKPVLGLTGIQARS
jgi:hypothetical protein